MNIGKTGPIVKSASLSSFVLAANTSIDLRDANNTVSEIMYLVKTGTSPTAAITINIFDGTVSNPLATTAIATGAIASVLSTGNTLVGPRVTNADAAVAGTLMYCGYRQQL